MRANKKRDKGCGDKCDDKAEEKRKELSEMTVTYDWEKDDWTALPLGVKVAKLVRFRQGAGTIFRRL